MKKTKKIAISLTTIALASVVVLSVFAAYCSNSPKRQFPMWQTPCFEPPEMNTQIRGMSFIGIDFEASTISDEAYDDVLVQLETIPGQGYSYAPLVWVDYFYADEWHTIWCNHQTMLSVTVVEGDQIVEEEREMKFHVQSGLFVRDGRYRLCVDNLGSCEMDIIRSKNRK